MRIALLQMLVGPDKAANLQRALDLVRTAAGRGSDIVVLPECFNAPYGVKHFAEYAEAVPDGPTCQSLAQVSSVEDIFLIGGSIPERDSGKLYNTCAVYNRGSYLGKYRKVHLFDIDIPGKIAFKESSALAPGPNLFTVELGEIKIGLGICYDMRFSELATIYAHQGCHLLVYPGAFNPVTGPKHWQLLLQARALDSQCFVAGCSPARTPGADYQSHGHSMLVSPDGSIVASAGSGDGEEIVYADMDLGHLHDLRSAIPTLRQKRTDLYHLQLTSPSSLVQGKG